jgi:HEAT repeat protein
VSLSAGWAALESGRVDEAVAAGEAALASYPNDHAATVLVISALTSGGRLPRAIESYETWAQAHAGGDIHLLAIVARGVLTTLGASAPMIEQRVAALEALSAAGDTAARQALDAMGAKAGVQGDATRAIGGDTDAGRRLVAAATSGSGSSRIAALEATADAKPEGAAEAIARATRDADPVIRAAGARLASRMNDPQMTDALLPLLKDASGDVRQSAALSLAAGGRSEGDELVSQMLATGIPDFVLAVAEALPEQPEKWEHAVRGLLDTESPIDRLRAARLIGATAPEDAARVVEQSLRDDNPAIRQEAARSLAAVPSARLGDGLPRLLADGDVWVRLRAAATILGESTGQPVQRVPRCADKLNRSAGPSRAPAAVRQGLLPCSRNSLPPPCSSVSARLPL